MNDTNTYKKGKEISTWAFYGMRRFYTLWVVTLGLICRLHSLLICFIVFDDALVCLLSVELQFIINGGNWSWLVLID